MKQLQAWLSKQLQHPVWSGIVGGIGVAILTPVVLGIWALLGDLTFRDTVNLLWVKLNHQIPIYYILFLIPLIYILRFVKLRRSAENDPIWEETIGNYTFGNLFEILTGEYLHLPEALNADAFYSENNLMYLFYNAATTLGQGVTYKTPNNFPKYLFHWLCPQLLVYDLVNKINIPMTPGSSVMEDMYILSENGKKLYALFSTRIVQRPKLYATVEAHKFTIISTQK